MGQTGTHEAGPPPGPPIAPLLIEAETGSRGADFKQLARQGLEYVAIGNNAAGGNPTAAARVISYRVEFPKPGDYDVYARVKVGREGASDDSLFLPNGFGMKDPTRDADWVLANGLGAVGHAKPDDVVGVNGRPVVGGWNWINLSRFVRAPDRLAFKVEAGKLSQTFQLGAREDGLEIDKLAFGPARISHTVAELTRQQPGRYIPPKPLPPPFTPQGPALATGKSKFLGGAYSNAQAVNFAAYFNQVTPENGGKWGSVEAVRDVMVWSELDAAYALAKKHRLPFKMHVMVWGNQQPAWIEQLSPREQLEEIEEWFSEVARRYPAMDYVEVVNEPLHDPPSKAGDGGGNYIKALGGDGKTGWDWVLTSFRMGRKHFPKSRLMLNEYSVTNTPADARRYKGIIELLQAERLIDAVGVQGHAFSTTVPASVTTENLNLLATTGLPMFVTELDIDGADDAQQLAEYQRVFPLFWQHSAIKGITLWGYRPGMWRTGQGANLALDNGAERPALVWLREYVKGTASGVNKAHAAVGVGQ